jgi:hypothetical protein
MFIENEGALFKGSSRGNPREIWHAKEKKWVPYEGKVPKPYEWGDEIDEAEAKRLMAGG